MRRAEEPLFDLLARLTGTLVLAVGGFAVMAKAMEWFIKAAAAGWESIKNLVL